MRNMKKIKKFFSDWNLFEKVFLVVGISLNILVNVIWGWDIVNFLYVLTYFLTALLMAKGKVASYFIGIVSVIFYGIVSYNQGYYGELLITIFLTFPIMIVGIVEWLKHIDKDEDVVIVKDLKKKEIVIAFASQLILYWGYYFLLKTFNTDLLILSSLSVVTSVLASYFEARRSEFSLFCYIANDLIIISLWVIPIFYGQTALISVLVGPLLLLVNDIYGSCNWIRLKKHQAKKGISEA